MKFGQNCKNLSRAVNHLLRCMTIFHPETVDDANSATESQLLLFQSQVCSLLVSQNFFSVQKNEITNPKDGRRWGRGGVKD